MNIIHSLLQWIVIHVQQYFVSNVKYCYAYVLYKDGKIYLRKRKGSSLFLEVTPQGTGVPLLEYSNDVPVEVYSKALKELSKRQVEGEETMSKVVYGAKRYNLNPFMNVIMTVAIVKVDYEPNKEWIPLKISQLPILSSSGIVYDILFNEVDYLQSSLL